MVSYQTTEFARQDLLDIFNFVADYDEAQAVQLLQLLDEKIKLITDFPLMGKTRHDLLIDLRSFPVKNYLIYYLLVTDGIEILRILHHSRDVEAVFSDFIENSAGDN